VGRPPGFSPRAVARKLRAERNRGNQSGRRLLKERPFLRRHTAVSPRSGGFGVRILWGEPFTCPSKFLILLVHLWPPENRGVGADGRDFAGFPILRHGRKPGYGGLTCHFQAPRAPILRISLTASPEVNSPASRQLSGATLTEPTSILVREPARFRLRSRRGYL
jgi:hypothetical protein